MQLVTTHVYFSDKLNLNFLKLKPSVLPFLLCEYFEIVQVTVLIFQNAKPKRKQCLIRKLCTLREPKQLQGVRALVYICESEASQPPVLDPMSFPFNIFIKVITHRTLYKTCVVVEI